MNFSAAFGIEVREARRLAKLTQTELGARAGLHLNFISMIERGKTSPALNSVCAIAQSLSVSPSELIARAERRVQAFESEIQAVSNDSH